MDYKTKEFIFSDNDIAKIKRINNKLKKEEQRIRNYITQLREMLKNQVHEKTIYGFIIGSCPIKWDRNNSSMHCSVSLRSTDFLFREPTPIKFEDTHPLAKEVFSYTISFLLNATDCFTWQDITEMDDISIDFKVKYYFSKLINEAKNIN